VLLAGGDYELRIPGQSPTPLPTTGRAHVAIHEPTVVRLEGAAYHGSVSLNPSACGEDEVHVITAAPKPAKLVFQAGALALSELIVSCVSGCPYQTRAAEGFPTLPFPRGDTELVVELEFKARGHRAQVAEFKLTPGDNPIRVTLQRVAD
jgi:hypothetical protein